MVVQYRDCRSQAVMDWMAAAMSSVAGTVQVELVEEL